MKKIIVIGGGCAGMMSAIRATDVGCNVKRLKRIKFVGLTLEGLPVGKWRTLTTAEISRLKGDSA